jgi:hypothetical protein
LDFSGVVKKNPQACLPTEEEVKYVSHVPALRHVKEPSNLVNYGLIAKFPWL